MDKFITIVGLGPGDPGVLPLQVWELLNDGSPVYLRTEIHPTVDWLKQKGIKFFALDHHYERCETFEEVYANIAQELVEAATRQSIVYGVPGHPMVAEDTVRRVTELAAAKGIGIKIVPAMSFLDAMWLALGLDPSKGIHIIDALRLEEQKPDPTVGTVVTQIYDRMIAGETKLSLMEYYPDEHRIAVVRAAGIPKEERIQRIPLYELDRLDWIDHLTSLYIEPTNVAASAAAAACLFPLDPLVEVMQNLRGEQGCPWDREQNHESLKPYLIEETYEVLEALEQGEMYKICEELGDLLLQIVFHAQIANEKDHFDINDVIQSIVEKMVRRHPHVFGSIHVKNSEEVLINWDKIKSQEQGGTAKEQPYLAGIPRALPALLRASKVQAKAARIGFDWPDYHGAVAKVTEELQEVLQAKKDCETQAVAEELGDLLFAVVNLARLLQVDSENALSLATNKFIDRFQFIEQQAAQAGKKLSELTLEQMDLWWEEAKIHKKQEKEEEKFASREEKLIK
ncbi:nucleoside triphosphate pyrophosphohydrolase [Desulfotomaculum sp. 1211_IL3151]|uniref:nucleoside triphosphate pyrophosphohydrolase n=1 Tax=Desulfotomaculum sp. 1211_IL3151 TaxID=3084055 RepID=UPI002FDA32C4